MMSHNSTLDFDWIQHVMSLPYLERFKPISVENAVSFKFYLYKSKKIRYEILKLGSQLPE